MSLLSVKNISKHISDNFSLAGISFTQQRGQRLAITGETGSGKSTLLRIVAGLLQADGGEVCLEKERVKGPEEQLIPGHPKIAYLAQTHDLRNNYRMEELLEYANRLPAGEAEKMYRVCRIEHLMKRKNVQLSGGEKQRVALTRLLIGAPSLLLLDEPFSNLDPMHKQVLKEVLDELSQQLGITSILTSHDPADTLSWADEILVLRGGTLVQQGAPEKLFYHPADTYVAGLFGPFSLLNAKQAAGFGITIDADQQLLVRPAGFRVDEHGVAVTISRSRFLGNFYYLEALLDEQPITMIHAGEIPEKLKIGIDRYTVV